MWLSFAILSTIFSGVRRIYDKHLSGHYGNFSMGFIFNFFAILPMAVILFFSHPAENIFHMPWQFWWPLLISWFLQYPIQNYLYIRAIREGEISSVAPLMSLLPVFNIITSYFLVREIPTKLGFLGILIIVFGTYLLLKKKGLRLNSKPEIFMIIAMFLAGFSSSLDKVALAVTTPIFYTFVSIVGTAIIFTFLMYMAGEFHELKKMHAKPGHLIAVGILFAVSLVTLEIAFSRGPTSYVLALRTGSFFIGAVWGFWKLKESMTVRKSIAILCFISGSLLLAFA